MTVIDVTGSRKEGFPMMPVFGIGETLEKELHMELDLGRAATVTSRLVTTPDVELTPNTEN